MDPRILEIKDHLDRAQELMGEIMAEQEPVDESQEDMPMPKEEYLAKPEEQRMAIDQKRVMTRKPKPVLGQDGV